MGLPAGAVRQIEAMETITHETWPAARRKLEMFARGAHIPWMTDSTVSVGSKTDDDEAVFLIYMKVQAEYQSLFDATTTTQSLFKKLVSTFEVSNMTTRMAARDAFATVTHDPSKPIDLYIVAIEDAVRRLTRLNATPSELEIKDRLLLNLHPAYHAIRASLTASVQEPSLAAVKAQLRTSGAAVALEPVVKQEEQDIALAARPDRRDARTGGRPRDPGFGGSTRKFRWCSAVSPDQCRRCGISGHISDRCVYDMPEHIKQWVMDGPPSASRRDRHAHRDADSSDDAHAADEVDVEDLRLAGYVYDPISDSDSVHSGYYRGDIDIVSA